MWTRRLIHSLLGCSLLGLSACFTYTPVQVGEVSPGSVARARLSAAAAASVGEVVPLTGRLVEGRVLAGDANLLLLEVPAAKDPTGRSGLLLHQRLQLPLEGVIELELRRLDRWRTGALVAAGAVAVGFVVARQFGGGTASTTMPPGTGGPSELLIPFQIPLRYLPGGR